MKTNLIIATLFTAGLAMAQVMIPDGTKVRVRLEENLCSDTAEVGQTVDFIVTQDVRIGDAIVVATGAPATGTIVQAQPKRRMGRAGKLDFSIDRVQLVDGNWLNVRYTPQKNSGKGNGLKAGVLTAGIAVVFWPAAPLGLLVKGHDVTVAKGRTYDVFADLSTYVTFTVPAGTPQLMRAMPQAPAVMVRTANGLPVDSGSLAAGVSSLVNGGLVSNIPMTSSMPASAAPAAPPAAVEANPGATAMVNINADQPGADLEVDGAFVGNAPTTIPLTPGMHKVTVRQGASRWERDIRITGGTVTINATLGEAVVLARNAGN